MGSRHAICLAALLAAFALAPRAARANELAAVANPGGFVIHDASETLTRYCRTDADGTLWLDLPGAAWELVTSIDDPVIANRGDGAFHPFDAAEVRATLAAVRFPLDRVGAEIFILPYPRRAGLESGAGAGLILLSPGTRPLAADRQRAELAHELGHVVQRALMPDTDTGAWDGYRTLRGIGNRDVYAASSAHANRPHEIFAEDFRALFGGPGADYSGSIENATIAPPRAVTGLAEFLLGLAGGNATLAMTALPNPARGAVRFARTGGAAVPLDVFDAQGRRVRTIAPVTAANVVRWSWDGRDESGRTVPAGVWFARVRGETGAATRVTIGR